MQTPAGVHVSLGGNLREQVNSPYIAGHSRLQYWAMLDNRATRITTLKKVPLFADLNEKEVGFLADRAVPHHPQDGELIFSEGEPCEGLYVIETGSVRIFKTSVSGREQVLTIEGPGQSIAELPVFDGGAYPASAAAVGDTTLLVVGKKDFQALCLQHPEVALKVLKVVGARLRRLVGIIEELSFTTVRHRLAALLLRLAKRKGAKTARGLEFTITASNQELAAHIGTVRELVSRNLSRFQAEGIVKLDGKTVIVLNLAALEAEVEGGE